MNKNKHFIKSINEKTFMKACFTGIALLFSLCANATELPKPIVDYIKKKVPCASVRFDGLVEFPDSTVYLPILPMVFGQNPPAVSVVQTIPKNKDLMDNPDMVLFNNNLALLKLVKNNGELTVNYSPEIPLMVKMGILPQDLVVPRGLVLPTELKVVLGDLQIPIKPVKKHDGELTINGKSQNDQNTQNTKNGKNNDKLPKEQQNGCLRQKAFYTASFKETTVNIIDPETGRIFKAFKFSSPIANIALTKDGKYLLASSLSEKKIFVIDANRNIVLKDIELEISPSYVLFSADGRKAFVASRNSSLLSEIDIVNMIFSKNIEIKGTADIIAETKDSSKILYNDRLSGTIYSLNTLSGESKPVMATKNVSKFSEFDGKLFVLSRLNSELSIFDLAQNKEIKTIKVAEKPVDMIFSPKNGEIYILASGADEVQVIKIDDYSTTYNIKLHTNGFPSSAVFLENENKLLITAQESFKITIFDTAKKQVIGQLPTEKGISFIQVLK